ncbi:TRAP transporter small permease [Acuticoccus sp.]|uniref:TRAP transporter small permease n=1 Tax=Acuticoccus sp. TaxID=1904378 RepID=UPI003B519D29
MIRAAETVGRAMTVVSIALMLMLCLPIAYEAVARAFGFPTIWVFETTLYAFIFLGFLGNALAVRAGSHFRVTLLATAFPALKPALDWIAVGATVVFALLIIASGVYFAAYSFEGDILSSTLLEVPLWIPQLAIPLGGLGLLLETLVAATRHRGLPVSHVMGD